MRWHIAACLLAFALTACDRKTPPSIPVKVPDLPAYVEVPPTPPTLKQVAYRPTFKFNKGRDQSAGTAFVVTAKNNDKYLLTAAHLMDANEWANTKEVVLTTMSGAPVGKSVGPAVFIGRGMDMQKHPPETEFDLVIFKLAPDDKTESLQLLKRSPNQNRLWVVGKEVTSKGGQTTFECKPHMSFSNKTVILNKVAGFNLQAFSGGPIVDHEGKVAATLLGGNDTEIIGLSIENLRKRLEEKGIEVE